jgi:prepilin-type N-terminal cleavage/methylation domain-containing protein
MNILPQKMLKNKNKSMKGFTLVEVLVALALLSIIGTGFLGVLGSASKVLLKSDFRETSRDLAQAQMEYIQNLAYKTTDPDGNLVFYAKVPNLAANYPGLDVEILAARVDKGSGIVEDTGMQKITVVVMRGADTAFTLMGMKVNRDTP